MSLILMIQKSMQLNYYIAKHLADTVNLNIKILKAKIRKAQFLALMEVFETTQIIHFTQ